VIGVDNALICTALTDVQLALAPECAMPQVNHVRDALRCVNLPLDVRGGVLAGLESQHPYYQRWIAVDLNLGGAIIALQLQ